MELETLKKVGPKTTTLLHKLNIYTIEDLINYYPYRYNIYKPVNLNECNTSDTITINAKIESTPKLSYIRRNLNRISFKALSKIVAKRNGLIWLVFGKSSVSTNIS